MNPVDIFPLVWLVHSPFTNAAVDEFLNSMQYTSEIKRLLKYNVSVKI